MLLTAFDIQTSMTSRWAQTLKRKILADKVTHCHSRMSQHCDWTKLFQLVFQCDPFLMNLLKCKKQRKEKENTFLRFISISLYSQKKCRTGSTNIQGCGLEGTIFNAGDQTKRFTITNLSMPFWRWWMQWINFSLQACLSLTLFWWAQKTAEKDIKQ